MVPFSSFPALIQHLHSHPVIGGSELGALQFRVGKTETKTLDFISGEYLEVSMVKISAQLDTVREEL